MGFRTPDGVPVLKYHLKSCCFPVKNVYVRAAEVILLNVFSQLVRICTATPHREFTIVLWSINITHVPVAGGELQSLQQKREDKVTVMKYRP